MERSVTQQTNPVLNIIVLSFRLEHGGLVFSLFTFRSHGQGSREQAGLQVVSFEKKLHYNVFLITPSHNRTMPDGYPVLQGTSFGNRDKLHSYSCYGPRASKNSIQIP